MKSIFVFYNETIWRWEIVWCCVDNMMKLCLLWMHNACKLDVNIVSLHSRQTDFTWACHQMHNWMSYQRLYLCTKAGCCNNSVTMDALIVSCSSARRAPVEGVPVCSVLWHPKVIWRKFQFSSWHFVRRFPPRVKLCDHHVCFLRRDSSSCERRPRLCTEMANHERNKKILLELVKQPLNNRCADCGAAGKRRACHLNVILHLQELL